MDRLTQEEIAEKTRHSVKNVEKILERARKRLGSALYISSGEHKRHTNAVGKYKAGFRLTKRQVEYEVFLWRRKNLIQQEKLLT